MLVHLLLPFRCSLATFDALHALLGLLALLALLMSVERIGGGRRLRTRLQSLRLRRQGIAVILVWDARRAGGAVATRLLTVECRLRFRELATGRCARLLCCRFNLHNSMVWYFYQFMMW